MTSEYTASLEHAKAANRVASFVSLCESLLSRGATQVSAFGITVHFAPPTPQTVLSTTAAPREIKRLSEEEKRRLVEDEYVP